MAQTTSDSILFAKNFASQIRTLLSEESCGSATFDQLAFVQDKLFGKNIDKFQLQSIYGILLDHSDLIHKPGQKIAAAFLIWHLWGSKVKACNPFNGMLIRLLGCDPTSSVAQQRSVYSSNDLNNAEVLFLKCLLLCRKEVREILAQTPREVHFMKTDRLPDVDIRPFVEECDRLRDGNISPTVPFEDSAVAAFLQQFELASSQSPDIRQQFSQLQTASQPPAVANDSLSQQQLVPEGASPAALSPPSLSTPTHSPAKVTSSQPRPPRTPPLSLVGTNVFPAAAVDRSNYLDLGDGGKTSGGDNASFNDRIQHALENDPLFLHPHLGSEEEEEEEEEEDDDDDDDETMSSSNSMRANSENSDDDNDHVVVTSMLDEDDLDDDDDDEEDDVEPGGDDSDADPDFDPTDAADKLVVGAKPGFVSVAQRASGAEASRAALLRSAATATSSISTSDDNPPPLIPASPIGSKSPRQNILHQQLSQQRQPASQTVYPDKNSSDNDFIRKSSAAGSVAENVMPPLVENVRNVVDENFLPEQQQLRPASGRSAANNTTVHYHPASSRPSAGSNNFRRNQQQFSHQVHANVENVGHNNNNNDMIKINWEVLHDDALEYDHQHRKLRRGRIYEDLERKMSGLDSYRIAHTLVGTCIDNICESKYTIPALAALDCLARHEQFGFDVICAVIESEGNFIRVLLEECEHWADVNVKNRHTLNINVILNEDELADEAKKNRAKSSDNKSRSSSASISDAATVVEGAALRLWFIHSWLEQLYRWRLMARKNLRAMALENQLVQSTAAASAAAAGTAGSSNSIPTANVDPDMAKLMSLIEQVRKCQINIEYLNRLWRCFGMQLGCTDQFFNFLVLCITRIPRHRQHHEIDDDNVIENENGGREKIPYFRDVRPYFQSMAVLVHVLRQVVPQFMQSRIDAQCAALTNDENSSSMPVVLPWPQSLNAALECYKSCCMHFSKIFDGDYEIENEDGQPVVVVEGYTWQKLALQAVDFLWSLTVDEPASALMLQKSSAVESATGINLSDIVVQQHDFVLMRIIELLNCLAFDCRPSDVDTPDNQARERLFLKNAVRRLQVCHDFVANACRSVAEEAVGGDFSVVDREKQKMASKRNVYIAREAAALLHRIVMILVKHMAAYRAQYSYHLQVRAQLGQNVLPLVSSTTATPTLIASLTNAHATTSSASALTLSTASTRIDVSVQISWTRRKSTSCSSPRHSSPLVYRANLPLQMHVGDLKACIMMFIYKKHEEERGGFELLWQEQKERRAKHRIRKRLLVDKQRTQESSSSQSTSISAAAYKAELEAAMDADTDDSFDEWDLYAENDAVYKGGKKSRDVVEADERVAGECAWYWKYIQQHTKLSRKRIILFNNFVKENGPLMVYLVQQTPATTSSTSASSSAATIQQQQQRIASATDKLLIHDRYTLADCNFRDSSSQACRLTAKLEVLPLAKSAAAEAYEAQQARLPNDVRNSQNLITESWPSLALIPHVYLSSESQNMEMLLDTTEQIYSTLVQQQQLSMHPQAVLYWRQCLRRVWDLLMMLPAAHSVLAELTYFRHAPNFSNTPAAATMKKSSSTDAVAMLAAKDAAANASRAAFWRKVLPFNAEEIVLDDDDDEDVKPSQNKRTSTSSNVLPLLLYRLLVLERVKTGPMYPIYRQTKKRDEWFGDLYRQGGVQRFLNLLTSMPLLSMNDADYPHERMAPVPNDEFAWRRDTLTILLKLLESVLLKADVEWQDFVDLQNTIMLRQFKAAASANGEQSTVCLSQPATQPTSGNGDEMLNRSAKRRYSFTTAERQMPSNSERVHAVSESGSSKDSVDDAAQKGLDEPPRKKALCERIDNSTAPPSSVVRLQQQAIAAPLPAVAPIVRGRFFGAAKPDVTYTPTVEELPPSSNSVGTVLNNNNNNGSRGYKPVSFNICTNANSISFANARLPPPPPPQQQQRNSTVRDAALIQQTLRINENLQRAKDIVADDHNIVCIVNPSMLSLMKPSISRIVHALLKVVSDSLPTLNTLPLLIDAINCAGVSSPQLMHELYSGAAGSSSASVSMLTSTYPPIQMFENFDSIRATLLCQQKRIARSATRLLVSWTHVSDRVVPLMICDDAVSSSSSLYCRYLHRVLVHSLSDDMSNDQLQRLEELLLHHWALYRDVMPLIETLKLLFGMVPKSVARKGGYGENSGRAIVDAAIREVDDIAQQPSDADGNKRKVSESTLALCDFGFQTFVSCMIPVSSVRLFTFLSSIISNIPDDAIVKHSIDLTAHLQWFAEQIALRPIYESRHNYFIVHEGDGDAVLIGMLQVCLAILTKRPSLAVTSVSLCERLAALCRHILFAQPKIATHITDGDNNAVVGNESSDDSASSPFEPKCKSGQARQSAYALLNALCNHNARLYRSTGEQLIMQHAPRTTSILPALSSAALYGWDYWPRDEIRSDCDRIGIVNLGATCYMACTMQQLFMIPQLRDAVLRARQCEKPKIALEPAAASESTMDAAVVGPNNIETSNSSALERILRELQRMFAYMMLSQRKAYNPDTFVRQYEMHGERLNPSEQKDMQEFYTDLLDKLSDMSPELKRVIGDTFEGRLCNSVICSDDECPHFSLRDEVFTSVHIPVQGYDDVTAALEHVTAEDALDGDNKYFCAECQKKVRAMKRTSFRTLPKILALNPMRYNFDTTTMARIKINSRFSFPDKLSMERFSEHNLLPLRVKQRQKLLAEEKLASEASPNSAATPLTMETGVSMPIAGISTVVVDSSPDRSSSGNESSKENCTPVDEMIESGSSSDAGGSSRCSSTSITAATTSGPRMNDVPYPLKKSSPESPLGEPELKRQRLTPPHAALTENEHEEILETDDSIAAKKVIRGTSVEPAKFNAASVGDSFSPSLDAEQQQLQCFDYMLVGVTVHTGTSEAGHYYAYIYDLEAEGQPQWLSFNDTEVRRFDVNCLPNEAFGGNLPPISFGRGNDSLLGGGGGGYLDLALERCNSAYMLFYEREDVFKARREALHKIRNNNSNLKVEMPTINPFAYADAGVLRSERASRLRNRARMQPANNFDRRTASVVPGSKSVMQYYVSSSAELMPPDLLRWMVADNCRFTSDLCIFDRCYTKFLMRFCQNALCASPQTTRAAQQQLVTAAAAQQNGDQKTNGAVNYDPPLNDSPCQFLATRLATMALLETLVHSRDRHHLNYFFELVTRCVSLSSDYSEWFLEMLLQPSNMWLVDVLIRCPLMPRRDLLKKLVVLAFNCVHTRVVRKLRASSITSTTGSADQQSPRELGSDYYFEMLQIIQKEQRRKLKSEIASNSAAVDANGNAVMTITIDDDDADDNNTARVDSSALLLAKVIHKLVSLVHADETVASYRYAGQLFELINYIGGIGDAECCAFVHYGCLAACTRLYYQLGEQRGGAGSHGDNNSSSLAATLSAALLQASTSGGGNNNSRSGYSANSELQPVSDDEFGPLNNSTSIGGGGDVDTSFTLNSDIDGSSNDELLRRRNSASSRLSTSNGTYLNFNNNNLSSLSTVQQQQQPHQSRLCTALEGMSSTLRTMTERYQFFSIRAAGSVSDDVEEWEIGLQEEVDENNDPIRRAAGRKTSEKQRNSSYSIEASLFEHGITEDDFINMIISLIADSPLFVDDLAKALACFCLGESTTTTAAVDADDGFQPVLHAVSQPPPHANLMDSNNNDMDANNDFDFSAYTHQQQQQRVASGNTKSGLTTTGEKSTRVIDLLMERICGGTTQQFTIGSNSLRGSSINSSAFGRPVGSGGASVFASHNSNSSFNNVSRQREVANLLQAVSTLARLSGQQYMSLQTMHAKQQELMIKVLGLTAAAGGKPTESNPPNSAQQINVEQQPPRSRLTTCSSFINLILPRVPQMFLRYPEAVVEWLQVDAVRLEPLREHVIVHISDMIRHVLIAGVHSFAAPVGQQQQSPYRFADKYAATYSQVAAGSSVGSLPIITLRKDREQLVQQLCVLALLVAMPFPRDLAALNAMPNPSYVHGLITQALNHNGGGLASANYEEHPTLLRYLPITRPTTAVAAVPGTTVLTPTSTSCLPTHEIRTLFANLFSVVSWLEIVYVRIQSPQQQQQISSSQGAVSMGPAHAPPTQVSIVAGDSITAYFLLLTWLMDSAQDDLVCSKFPIIQRVFVLQMRLQQLGARDDMRWALMLFIAAGVKYLPKFRYLVLHDAEMQNCFLKSPLATLEQQLIATGSTLSSSLMTTNGGPALPQWDVATKFLGSATTRRNNSNILPALAAAVMGGGNGALIATLWQKSNVVLRCLGQWLIYKSNLALVDRKQCVALCAPQQSRGGGTSNGMPLFAVVLNELLLYAAEILPSSTSSSSGNMFGTTQQQQIMHCIDQSLRILFETLPCRIADGTYSSDSFDFAALIAAEYGGMPMEVCSTRSASAVGVARSRGGATVAEPGAAAAPAPPVDAALRAQLSASTQLATTTTSSSSSSAGGGRRRTPDEEEQDENNDAVAVLLNNNNNSIQNNNDGRSSSPVYHAAPAAYIEQLLESMPMPPLNNSANRFASAGYQLSPPAGVSAAVQPTNSGGSSSSQPAAKSAATGSSSSSIVDDNNEVDNNSVATTDVVVDNVRVKQALLNLRIHIIRAVVNYMVSTRSETSTRRCFRLIRRLLYCPSDALNGSMMMEDDEQHASESNNNNDDSVAACFELDADDCCMLLRAFRCRIYMPLIDIIVHHINCYKQQREMDQNAARAAKLLAAAAAAAAATGNAHGQQQLDLNSSNSSATPSPVIALFTRDNQVELHFAITRLQSMLGLVEPRAKQLQADHDEVKKQLMQLQLKLQSTLDAVKPDSSIKTTETAVVSATPPSGAATSSSTVAIPPAASSQTAKYADVVIDLNDLDSVIAATTQLEQRRLATKQELDSLTECRKHVEHLLRTSTTDLNLSVSLSMLVDYGFEIFITRLAAKDAQMARAASSGSAGVGTSSSSSRKSVLDHLDEEDDGDDDDDDEDEDDIDIESDDEDEEDEDDENDEDDDDDDDDEEDDDSHMNVPREAQKSSGGAKDKDFKSFNAMLAREFKRHIKDKKNSGSLTKAARRLGLVGSRNDAIVESMFARETLPAQQQHRRNAVIEEEDDDMSDTSTAAGEAVRKNDAVRDKQLMQNDPRKEPNNCPRGEI